MTDGAARAGWRTWMEQALALAALGEGATSPNPRVGCVLVKSGRAVGNVDPTELADSLMGIVASLSAGEKSSQTHQALAGFYSAFPLNCILPSWLAPLLGE